MGQPIAALVPHAVAAILEHKGHHWISPSWLAKDQALLLEQDDTTLKTSSSLNPATLLPIAEQEPLHHDCMVVIEQVYASRPDLKHQPLENADLELYTDRSSFKHKGVQKAGYAVVTIDKETEDRSLPWNTSAQKAELIALT